MNFHNRHKLVKIAFTVTELNDPVAAGYAIAQSIKFLARNIPFDRRQAILNKVKQKILYLNAKELSLKKIPTTAILGQIIALVKNLLHGNEAELVKNILHNIYKNL